MKKIFIMLAAAGVFKAAVAQDIDDVKNLYYLQQFGKLKETVDKYLSVEKNAKKPEGWYFKGYAINQLSKDAAKSVDESSAMKAEAFDLFKKYRQMDPKAEELATVNNAPLFDLYVGFSNDLAIKAYNAKNLAGALDNFKKGLDVHDYIFNNGLAGNGGYKFSAVDTIVTLYAGLTAHELKKSDEAMIYFKKLTDAGIGGKDYLDAYQLQSDYFKTKQDQAAFDDIIAKGRKLYPENEEFWVGMEIEFALNGAEKQATFPKYEQLIAKYPSNYTIAYNYAVELYNYLNSDDSKTDPKKPELRNKLQEVMKKALAVQSTFEGNFIMANYLYYASFDLSEEAKKIKGPKPEDLKRKKAMEADALKMTNDAAPYAEAGVAAFSSVKKPKASDKIHYKQMLTILKSIYETRKDAAKVAAYDKLIKEAE